MCSHMCDHLPAPMLIQTTQQCLEWMSSEVQMKREEQTVLGTEMEDAASLAHGDQI